MTDRMAALERVAEAARASYRDPHIYRSVEERQAEMREIVAALDALDALPAEPVGEAVEVMAAVLVNADGAPSLCDMTSSGQSSRLALNSWLRNGFQHIATITARVPIPVIPTVAAKVEG